jgi:hypothetical protein
MNHAASSILLYNGYSKCLTEVVLWISIYVSLIHTCYMCSRCIPFLTPRQVPSGMEPLEQPGAGNSPGPLSNWHMHIQSKILTERHKNWKLAALTITNQQKLLIISAYCVCSWHHVHRLRGWKGHTCIRWFCLPCKHPKHFPGIWISNTWPPYHYNYDYRALRMWFLHA